VAICNLPYFVYVQFEVFVDTDGTNHNYKEVILDQLLNCIHKTPNTDTGSFFTISLKLMHLVQLGAYSSINRMLMVVVKTANGLIQMVR
jgi:hypothetical protein